MNPICEQLTNLAKERMKLEIKMRTHIFFYPTNFKIQSGSKNEEKLAGQGEGGDCKTFNFLS
jgi:hypothetical protein